MIALALSLLAAGADAPPVDFAKIPRTIAKTPTFTSKKPLYALFLFGEKHDARVWAVLDQGRADKPDYDVLYLDLEGTATSLNPRIGSLGKSRRRATRQPARRSPTNSRSTGSMSAGKSTGPSLSSPRGRASHTNYLGKEAHLVRPLRPRLRAPREARGIAREGADPRAGGAGPFQFELSSGEALVRGDADTVQLLIGNVGSERGAFSTTSNDLLPKNDYVVVELVYTDKDNKQKSFLAELRERC